MPAMTAEQRRRRDLVESGIRVVAPVLNLVLAAGERMSRIVAPDDPEYYPPRAGDIEPPPAPEPESRKGE